MRGRRTGGRQVLRMAPGKFSYGVGTGVPGPSASLGRSGPHWLRPRHPIVLARIGCSAWTQAMEQQGCQFRATQSAARDAGVGQLLGEGGNLVVERLDS